MSGLVLLLALSLVMALASFLAGSLPLAISLSPSQLRIITSLGIGILVGTSMIVIIPEGVEAVVSSAAEAAGHSHGTRGLHSETFHSTVSTIRAPRSNIKEFVHDSASGLDEYVDSLGIHPRRPEEEEEKKDDHDHDHDHDHAQDQAPSPADEPHGHDEGDHTDLPTFDIGLSMVLGFVLMFLIDRIPRHAADRMTSEPQMRHVNLNNLGASSSAEQEESEGFLGALTPPPKQSRSFATTIGLVIHAFADGIAMGAGATTSDTQLGLIIFIAIMLHKAPAAFGLSSVLLKQGLSKRAARAHLVVFSLAAPMGALVTWALITVLGGGHLEGPSGKWWTGMLLLFSAGTFLYVAMHAMNEEAGSKHDHHGGSHSYNDPHASNNEKEQPQLRDTLITVVGMLLPLLTQFGHHH